MDARTAEAAHWARTSAGRLSNLVYLRAPAEVVAGELTLLLERLAVLYGPGFWDVFAAAVRAAEERRADG